MANNRDGMTEDGFSQADLMHFAIAANGEAMGLRPGQAFRVAFWASLDAALDHGITPEELKSDVDDLVQLRKSNERARADGN
jgi:hypothetical protein